MGREVGWVERSEPHQDLKNWPMPAFEQALGEGAREHL
jgi:hypothetical protein